MKTISFFTGLLFLAGLSTVNAQMGSTPPAKVTAEFVKLYPNVKDVKWHMEDGNYEGKFNSGKMEMSVQINEKGELVQKETYLKVSDLPKPAQDYLTKNYKGVKIDEVSEVTYSKNVKHFQVEIKGKVLIFDTKGTFTKEEKDDDDDD